MHARLWHQAINLYFVNCPPIESHFVIFSAHQSYPLYISSIYPIVVIFACRILCGSLYWLVWWLIALTLCFMLCWYTPSIWDSSTSMYDTIGKVIVGICYKLRVVRFSYVYINFAILIIHNRRLKVWAFISLRSVNHTISHVCIRPLVVKNTLRVWGEML